MVNNGNEVANNLAQLYQKINAALKQYSRPANSVQVIAVSKTQPITKIKQAIAAGQYRFGENYLQEAIPKILALTPLGQPLEWHFIGAIQSNKTHSIAEHFTWVHSVASLRIAERLHTQRPAHLPPLNICLQINIDAESSKAGISLHALPELAYQISKLSGLKLRGLMAIPAAQPDFNRQRQSFEHLQQAFTQLQNTGLALDTLSMGMSNDFMAAIAAGATLLRIGTAIFGERSRARTATA